MISVFEGGSLEEVWEHVTDAFCDLRAVSNAQDMVQESRVGPTLELLHSVIHLTDPRQRWAYSRRPALNPAFALAEVIWLLGGRQDSAFLNYWNPVLPKFAGHGPTYHGAYGYRLRHEHGVDQLQRAYEALKNQPDSRQVVLQVWKPQLDLPEADGTPVAPDVPCNISSLLKIRNGRLEWTQIMRSNDLYRGLPHNIVQWTSVQEVMAGWLGVEVGSYVHLSDSLHVYNEHWPYLRGDSTRVDLQRNCLSNTDSLALSKNVFDALFPVVERNADRMTQEELALDELPFLIKCDEAPEAYRNILRVLAADSARRRGWSEIAASVMSDCTNPSFRFLWDQWVIRRVAAESAKVK